MLDFLGSEEFIGVLLALFGAAYTFYKQSEWRERQAEGKYAKVLDIVDAQVQETYDYFVRGRKADNGGKLTDRDRGTARMRTRTQSIDLGERMGVNVVGTLGSKEILDRKIEESIVEMKRKATQ